MTCRHCGRETPEGRFCTWCGRNQDAEGAARSDRQFAAAPNERVLSPAVITTLLPHLGRRGVREYRWAFVAGIVALLALYGLGLITAAFFLAAALVPVIYVLYLYEARVYRDAPIPVMLATVGGGLLIGVLATFAFDALLAQRPVFVEGAEGPIIDLTGLLVAAVVLPLVIEVLKPLPALLLRGRRQFGQSIDGLVFGVAAGLGFAAAETIVHYAPVLSRLAVRSEPGLWILPLLSTAILVPILHGSTTGLVAGSIWRLGRAPLSRLATLAIGAALLGHVAFALGTHLVNAARVHGALVLVWQGAVVLALLLVMRLLLNATLHEEATEAGLGRSTCANCGSPVLAAGFCPVCGVALTATAHVTTAVPEPATSGSTAGGAR